MTAFSFTRATRKILPTRPRLRYEEKDALKPHTVPAVAEFCKAVEEAEKPSQQP